MGGAITCEIAIRKKLSLAGMVLLSSGGDLKNYTPLVDSLKEVPVEQFHVKEVFSYLFGTEITEKEKKVITEKFDSLDN